MKIYAIRHGETELNKKNIFNGSIDEDLTLEGIKQSIAMRLLLPNNIKHIYSSSLKRARETAEILNANIKAPISFHDELREVNAGSFNGQHFTGERKIIHRSLQYDWRPEGGESVEDVKKRVSKILAKIVLDKNDGEVLVVTHGGIIRLLHFLETETLLGDIENLSLRIFDLDRILNIK